MARKVRKPYAFLMVSFALLLQPSTIPLDIALAANQLRSRDRCVRIVQATFFIGSICDRMTAVHQLSRNLPAQVAEVYCQKLWKLSLSKEQRRERRLYRVISASLSRSFGVRLTGRRSRARSVELS